MLRVGIVCPPYGEGPQSMVPLGAQCVAAYSDHHLGSEVEVILYDCSGGQEDEITVLDELISEGTFLVGFVIYSTHVDTVIRWARYLREQAPDIVLVAGGPHITLDWFGMTQRWGKLFDYTIAGEGERPFTALVKAMMQHGKICEVKIPGVGFISSESVPVLTSQDDALFPCDWPNPFRAKQYRKVPNVKFTDLRDGISRHAVGLVTSRSCPMRCHFCAIVAMGKKWRAAPVEKVINWLVDEYRRHAFEHIYFMDANFFVQPNRVRSLAQNLSEIFHNVTWSASSTVKMLLQMSTDVPTLVQQGLRMVELGLESGSQRQLNLLGKKVSIAENFQAVQLLHKNGVQIGLDYIMFYPDQTIVELKENIKFLHEAALTQQYPFDHLFNALQLYPGTPLRKHYACKLGLDLNPDHLPDPATLFCDPIVKEIYHFFSEDFKRNYLPPVIELLNRLRKAAHRLRTTHPKHAQRVRLEMIALRHLPFKVLWSLTETANADSLEEAVPILRDFHKDVQRINQYLLHIPEESK